MSVLPRRITAALIAFLGTVAPALGYTVFLRDGAKVIAREAYRVDGDKAIIVLVNGTETFIDAAEIDVERTRDANQSNLGDALVLEGGEFTQIKGEPREQGPQSLRDLIARGDIQISGPPQARREGSRSDTEEVRQTAAGYTDLRTLGREPFGDLTLAEELLSRLREKGVETAAVWRGTTADRPLVEIEASTEAGVFRAMTASARSLLEMAADHPEISTLEIWIGTQSRQRAGQFVLDLENASELAGGMTPSEFFVRHVQF